MRSIWGGKNSVVFKFEGGVARCWEEKIPKILSFLSQLIENPKLYERYGGFIPFWPLKTVVSRLLLFQIVLGGGGGGNLPFMFNRCPRYVFCGFWVLTFHHHCTPWKLRKKWFLSHLYLFLEFVPPLSLFQIEVGNLYLTCTFSSGGKCVFLRFQLVILFAPPYRPQKVSFSPFF